jgi:IS5 family transposase
MQSDKTHPLNAGHYAGAAAGNHAFHMRRIPTQRERFLSEMERVLPWSKLRAMVAPVYADPKNRRADPLDMDRMLRVYLLQRWYGLSDAAAHDALRDSNAMHAFACVGLMADRAPSEITICGYRLLLDEYGLGNTLIEAADRHLRSLGVSISPGAIFDPAIEYSRISAGAASGALETRQ